MTGFFNQWLYQGGNIQLKGSWSYNAKTKTINIELQQVQPEKYIFNMPLEIGIQASGKNTEQIEVVNLDKRNIKISIPSQTAPINIRLDPNTKLLAEWDFHQKEK